MKNKTFIEHLRNVVVSPNHEQLNLIDEKLGWKKTSTKKQSNYEDEPSKCESLSNAFYYNTPLDKGVALINVFKTLENKIKKEKEGLIFVGDDSEKDLIYKKKIDKNIKNLELEKLETLLYLQEAIKNKFFDKPQAVISAVFKKKNKKQKEERNFELEEAQYLIDHHLKFNTSDDIHSGILLQLKGVIPMYPIANSLSGFEMLDWQLELLSLLSANQNVIVCTPTSSGKTFIVVAYLINALKRFYGKKLYYCAPNNTLAMEIATMFNKITDLESKVSYLLDFESRRLADERIIVFTPQGAINQGILDEIKDGIFCMDEVHAISHNPLQEIVLQKFAESSCQKIILSATLSHESIDKLVEMLSANVIKANTRFMVHQRWLITRDGLKPFSPIGALNQECLNQNFEDLDLVLTPYDAVLFYQEVLKQLGEEKMDVSLTPEVYFGLEGRKVEKNWDEFFEEDIYGVVKRYSLKQVQDWVMDILRFLRGKEKINEIFNHFKISALDENVLTYDLENVFNLVLELKNKDLLPALFFHSNEADAINYALKLYHYLNLIPVNEKEMEKRIKNHETRKKEMEKLLRNAEKAPLSHGEKRADRKYRLDKLKEELDNLTHSFDHQIHPDRSLVGENQIEFESFQTYSKLMQEWDTNLKYSHVLVQMIMNGIGILIPSMSVELQSFIRSQYSSGTIKLLMTEKCMAYGINTPTRTSIISPELDIIDQIQAAGRAGRKGYEKQGNIVFFKQEKIDLTNCLLPKIEGKNVKIFAEELMPDESFFTEFELEENEIRITKNFSSKALLFEKSALLAVPYTDVMMEELKGESNKPVKFLVGLMNILPEKMVMTNEKDWSYKFPPNLTKFFENYGLSLKPNRLVHDYLLNMNDIDFEEKKRIIQCSHAWEEMIYLLIGYHQDYPPIKNILEECLKLIAKSKIRCLCN